jgi:hypothetical protein
MSTVKSKKLQVGTDATSSNNFTIYQPSTPDGTLRIGVGNADSPTEVGQFNANGYKPASPHLFYAKGTTGQSISASTWTVLQLADEVYDTDNEYDTSTYRFTPTVSGYYQLNGTFMKTSGSSHQIIGFWKNGSKFIQGAYSTNDQYAVSTSCIIYMNGSTDYVTMMGYSNVSVTSNATNTHFQGHLIAQA